MRPSEGCGRFAGLAVLVFGLLFPVNLLAGKVDEALKKWGVSPDQGKSSALDYGQRRQPFIENYPFWLALKYLPDYHDEETVRQYVVKELQHARRFYIDYKGRGAGATWLSREEVIDRNPELAAPDFMDRYKRFVREFVGGLSTRVRMKCSSSVSAKAQYDTRSGRLWLGHPEAGPRGRIALGGYNDLGDKLSDSYSGYIDLVRIYGEDAASRAADATAGHTLGWICGGKGGGEKIRLPPGTVRPMILSSMAPTRFYIAYDKDLLVDGLPMSKREAERFINRYTMGGGRDEVDLTITGAIRLRPKDPRTREYDAIILLADVEEVRLYTPQYQVREKGRTLWKDDLLKTYKRSDLKPARLTLADQRGILEKRKREQADKARKAQEALQQQIQAKTRECEESDMPQCWGALCKLLAQAGDRQKVAWCTGKRKQSIRNYGKRISGTMENAARQLVQDKAALLPKGADIPGYCKGRFSGRNAAAWYPRVGSPEYDAAMESCRLEKPRSPFGPDILGLSLGMTKHEARPLLDRQNMLRLTDSNDARPFHDAQLYWTKKGEHGIALFYLYNADQQRVAGISRRLYFDDKDVKPDALITGLRKKYGRESWRGKRKNGDEAMLWVNPVDGQGGSGAASCGQLVEMIRPRGDWQHVWKAPRQRSGAARRAAVPDAGSTGDVQRQCMEEAGMAGGGLPDMNKIMAMQACMRSKLASGMGMPARPDAREKKSDPGARKPLMLGKAGSATSYAKLKACAPAVIANFQTREDGKMDNLSLLLVSPAWLSELPAFMFTSGGGSSDSGDGVQF
ncbi:MAG TPA: hypothetical protein ENJ79_04770 [Gammaproteobacteria bacterium]|nr:hypothetical protein [Gammaproteobacteria bacterium]